MKLIFNEIRKAGEWVKTHPTESAKVLGPLWGNLDTATVELANSHRTYDVKAVVPESLTEQQKIADAFFREKLIPREINARDVTLWNPEAAITAVAR
jgi:sulfonate transport system substrate-binding protein